MKQKKERKRNIIGQKDRIIREIRTLFEREVKKENYYEPKRMSNFWNNSSIKYESNGEKNRNLSLASILTKLKLTLKSW